VNKQLGQVYIGKKIGYRGATSVGVGGTALDGEVKFLDTGTKLSFRPYIGNDGYIRMDIHPKDSDGAINITTSVPDETSTELATNILVKDGQTIVIGGLFRNQVTTGRSQVPIVGNLPLVGALFRGTTDTTTRQEVVVMMTPHILNEPNQGQDGQAVADAERRQQAAKDGQQTFARNKMEQTWYVRACRFYMDGDMENALLNCNRALQLCPTYLDAIRLKESIMAETDPDAFARLDRNLRKEVQWQLESD
jgi:type IV pilus assembly protein PilQ